MAPPQSIMLEITETPLPFLHEDIIIDNILVRLHVKSVGRFRCISKSWHYLLSNPKFARANLNFHTHNQPEGSILLRCSYVHPFFHTLNLENKSTTTVSKKLRIPWSYDVYGIWPLGSCHGLVLVELKLQSCKKILCLVNPITLESLNIFLKPNKHYYNHGLGYDSLHDDYKIISVSRGKQKSLHIYSVKMKTWTTRMDTPYKLFGYDGYFLNGCLHWSALKLNGGKAVIAAFSVSGKKFDDLPLPQGIDENILSSRDFTVLGGCLTLKSFLLSGSWDIWVMKEYGVQDSWTNFRVPIPKGGSKLRHVNILGEDELVFTNKKNEWVAYDWRLRAWRNIGGARVKFNNILRSCLVHVGSKFLRIW